MQGMLSGVLVVAAFAVVTASAAIVAARLYRVSRWAPPGGPGGPEPHPDLAPLLFLLGRWEGAGVGGYPTIESFRFGQEIIFGHNGKPFLIYTSRTWRLDEEGRVGPPLGTESGYWRPRPDHQVEVMLA